MAGPIARWILRRVIKSAMAFETDSIELYRRLVGQMAGEAAPSKSCREELHASLCHLMEEEQEHWRLLHDASTGRLSVEELERLLASHRYAQYESIEPLPPQELALWGTELARALAQEEKTLIFYGNLRRMSKIPVVKRAFEVLATMEREHLEILRRLLGKG